MQALLLRAGIAKSAHFSHAGMIVASGVPGAFNALARGGNRCAGVTGIDGHTDTGLAQVQSPFPCHFRSTQGGTRGTPHDRRTNLLDNPPALQRMPVTPTVWPSAQA